MTDTLKTYPARLAATQARPFPVWGLWLGLTLASAGCDGVNTRLGTQSLLADAGVVAGPTFEFAQCGNGEVERGEECEPPGTGACSEGCQNLAPRCGDGTLGDREECDDGNTVDGDGCSRSCEREECGNGRTEGLEECEPPDGVACDRNCRVLAPSGCGDRVLDLGEECDDGNADPGDGCSDLCLIEECGNRRIDFGETCEPPGEGICQPDCQRFVPPQATCGDSIQESTEQCDDGNTVGADGCSPQCRLEECGNLVLDEGESCEPPGAFGCSADCQRELTVAAVCGDSVVSGSEQCDDGGRQDGDGCSAACLAEECGNGRLDFGEECEPPGVGLCGDRCVRHRCGNGKVEGNEECDDHNLLLGDGCDSQCRREFCGNGRIDRALGENCELPSSGSCGSDCRTVVPTCGNGLREAGEQCDDGNRLFGDGCNLDCEVEVCGNGELDYPGECEPPGTASCDSSCRRFSRVCGDGLLVSGEECEDGNALPGDGCDSLCRLEGCGNGRVEPAIGEQCEPPGSAVCDARCMKVGVAAGVAVGPVPRSTALLRTANPEFDGSVAGWHSSSRARLTLSSDDHEARVGSGSALLAVGPKLQSVGAMQQCVPMGGGVEYRVQAQIRSPPTASAVAGITVEHFSSPACAESSALGGGFSTYAQSTPNWSLLRLPPASFPPDAVQAPEGARSVLVSVTATRTSEKPALLLVDSVHVSPSSGSRCGNGLVEPPDEECEPNTDRGCSAECLLPSVCGDGVVSGGEQCEPLLAGRACRPDTCSWVVRSFCGDGRVEAGEQCDPPSLTLGCGSDCQPIRCGNGITEPPEQCDAPGDPSCSARCLRVIPSECGNGVVEPGEQCDPPNLTDPAALCTMQCQALPPAECGNGTVERPVEQCDPPSWDCSARCQWLPNVCQDGRVGPGEQCDPPDGLFCSQSCQRPACYSCLAEQCTPPARAADLFAACDQLPGLAPTGPGRGRPRADLCREAVDCIKRTGCAQATDAWAASACYCGSDVLEREDPRFDVSPERLLACRDGVSEPRGACKAAFERAAESTVAEEVLAALARPDSERALGRANALLRDCGLGGPAACRSECAPDAGACGNGVVEANERCDPQDPVTGNGCDPTYCTVLPCGNGVIDRVYPPEGGEPPEGWLQEDCDVADPFSRLRCDLDCQLITTCGDGNVEGKEQCDPGPEGDWSKCCRSGNAQLLAACDRNDDGVVAADEQCRVVASCGDGVRDGAEECDDGALGSDACSPECKFRGPCADCSQLYCQYQIDEWEVRHLEPYKVQALEALACMEETGCFDASRTQCICGELSQLFCGAFGGGIEGTSAAGLRPDQGGACYPLLAAATESACDPPPPGQTVASCTTSRAGNVESGYGAARQLQICRRINCNQECGMAPW